MDQIEAKDLKVKLDAGSVPVIVDLQAAHEYEHRHIPGAVNVPEDDTFEEAITSIAPDKAAEVILYGEFDELGKGSKAGEKLEALGYTSVTRLIGGLMGYMEAGFTVEGGRES